MREFMSIAKALADENRVRMLMFMGGGELCVCQIMELLGLAPSTVSKHLTILHQAGLVESRKEGRWVYYGLPEAPSTCVKQAMEWLRASLAKDPQVIQDNRQTKAVLKMDKEQLCCRYKSQESQ